MINKILNKLMCQLKDRKMGIGYMNRYYLSDNDLTILINVLDEKIYKECNDLDLIKEFTPSSSTYTYYLTIDEQKYIYNALSYLAKEIFSYDINQIIDNFSAQEDSTFYFSEKEVLLIFLALAVYKNKENNNA